MPRHYDQEDLSSTRDTPLTDEEAWELDPEIVPISRESEAQEADLKTAISWLGYRHPGLEKIYAESNDDPKVMDEKLRLLNNVCVPVDIVNGVCVTNFETANAYLQGKQNQKGGQWPQVKYMISIMDPPSKNPLHWNLWDDLKPRDKNEFPKENLLHIQMADSKKACAIDFFPEICTFIHNAVETRSSPDDYILVHCRKGMSRSVAMVMAYLIWSQRISVEAALDDVLASRMVACPNSGFYRQCAIWAQIDCKLYSFDDGFSKELRMDPKYLKMRQDMNLQIYGRQPDTKTLEGIERPSPFGKAKEPLLKFVR